MVQACNNGLLCDEVKRLNHIEKNGVQGMGFLPACGKRIQYNRFVILISYLFGFYSIFPLWFFPNSYICIFFSLFFFQHFHSLHTFWILHSFFASLLFFLFPYRTFLCSQSVQFPFCVFLILSSTLHDYSRRWNLRLVFWWDVKLWKMMIEHFWCDL